MCVLKDNTSRLQNWKTIFTVRIWLEPIFWFKSEKLIGSFNFCFCPRVIYHFRFMYILDDKNFINSWLFKRLLPLVIIYLFIWSQRIRHQISLLAEPSPWPLFSTSSQICPGSILVDYSSWLVIVNNKAMKRQVRSIETLGISSSAKPPITSLLLRLTTTSLLGMPGTTLTISIMNWKFCNTKKSM